MKIHPGMVAGDTMRASSGPRVLPRGHRGTSTPEHPALPVRPALLRTLQIRERLAVDALATGTATDDDRHLIGVSLRVALLLAADGYGAEHATTFEAALELDADPELIAFALDVHDEQRRIVPQRRYRAALQAIAL
jgi:hypothetical protein